MLQGVSKALRPSLLAAARPGLAGGVPRSIASASGGPSGGSGDDRTKGAQQAADEFMRAAQDSVRHAAEGSPSALAQDAVSMAQSAARGAFETARLVADTVTGGMMGLGGGQVGRSETGKAFERVGDAVSDAAGNVGGAVSGAAATMTDQAGMGLQQAASGLSGNTFQATGPESTYGEHAFRGEGGAKGDVPSPAGAGPEEIKERALGEHWSGTPSATGEGRRATVPEDVGFTGNTGVGTLGPKVTPVEPGADVEVGLGGHVSERSAKDDEFGVTREEGEAAKQ